MKAFNLYATLNENIYNNIIRTIRDLNVSIQDYRHSGKYDAIFEQFFAFENKLLNEEQNIVTEFEEAIKRIFLTKFIDSNKALDCINFCKFQLGTNLDVLNIEGGPLSEKYIFSAADIPALTDVTYYCGYNEMKLHTHELLFHFNESKQLSFELEDGMNKLFYYLVEYFDFYTLKFLHLALKKLDAEKALDSLYPNNPIIINYGEPNNAMYTAYVLKDNLWIIN